MSSAPPSQAPHAPRPSRRGSGAKGPPPGGATPAASKRDRRTRLGYPAPVGMALGQGARSSLDLLAAQDVASRLASLVPPTPSQLTGPGAPPPISAAVDDTLVATHVDVHGPTADATDPGRPLDPSSGATLMQPGMVMAGKYRLVAPIASGGMGQVWLALHMRLGRRVALKVLHRERRQDAHIRERFRREALTVGQLRHPGIVQPLDFGTLEDGRDFLAMEYVEGLSLDHAISNHGTLPWRTALDVALDVSEALAFAHAHGIIHRDLKPANLILEGGLRAGGKVRLLDLGIARNETLRGERTLTERGMVLGTPAYASPEQLRGERVGPQSDLYSLGVILYRMVVGRLPYEGSSFAEVAGAQLAGPPPAPFDLRPDRTRPAELDQIIMRLLRYQADERPASAADLNASLRALLWDDDETARYQTARRGSASPKRRSRTATLGAIFLTGFAGAAVGLSAAAAIGYALAHLLGG